MSETSDRLLRGYQAQEKRFLERRFPLRFTPENPTLRELYRQAKGFRWNPETDIAWSRFDPEAYAPPVREAARLVWSRRAWGTYPGLGENTALLIRFCLESGATGMDAKLFLSFRPAEEAKHLEACFLFAERLGGYEPDPPHAAIARASNQPFAQMVLDPDVPVEAVVAALGCLDDQLDLNLCQDGADVELRSKVHVLPVPAGICHAVPPLALSRTSVYPNCDGEGRSWIPGGTWLTPTPYAGCVAPYDLGLRSPRDLCMLVDVSQLAQVWGRGTAVPSNLYPTTWRGGAVEFIVPGPIPLQHVRELIRLDTCGDQV